MMGLKRMFWFLRRMLRPAAKEATGQIRPMSLLGWQITVLSLDWKVRTILEIGTWKGEGSTRCIANGVRIRNRINRRVTAQSIESNREMFLIAAENHLHGTTGLDLLWGRIVDADELQDEDLSPQEKLWIDNDREALKTAPDVREMLPESIDLLILDGGEFSTEAEFEYLVRRIKRWVVLDDTLMRKTKAIHSNLASGRYGPFRCIYSSSARNGFAIWLRV